MHANLFGDFVKGKDLSRYPDSVQKGIRLHRTIDFYIDNHPAVLDLLHKLYEPLPKIASIAIDLYFDHLLAKKWDQFHSTPFKRFIQDFENAEVDTTHFDKEFFLVVLSKMKQEHWLLHYAEVEGLRRASHGLSRRISFENVLHKAPEVFLDNETIITEAFEKYMLDAQTYFSDYYRENNL